MTVLIEHHAIIVRFAIMTAIVIVKHRGTATTGNCKNHR